MKFIIKHTDNKNRSGYRTASENNGARYWQPFKEKAEQYDIEMTAEIVKAFLGDFGLEDRITIERIS